MVHALLLQLFVVVHRTQQVLYVVYEALAVRKAPQQQWLPAVRTFRLALLDPGPEAVVAGELTARGTHPRLLHILKADVALQERQVLPIVITTLHSYI